MWYDTVCVCVHEPQCEQNQSTIFTKPMKERERIEKYIYVYNNYYSLTLYPGSPQNMKDDNDLKACTTNDVQTVGDEYVVMNREVKNPMYDATDTLIRDAQTSRGVYELKN